MSRCVNKAILVGNVGQDPEIRTTTSGTRVARVSLATNRSYQNRAGEKVEETEWHRLTFWGKLADIVEQWVHKGDRIYVEGPIHYSSSEDGGVTRYWTEIQVRELVMLGSSSGGQGDSSGGYGGGQRAAAGGGYGGQGGPPISDPDDDLPF